MDGAIATDITDRATGVLISTTDNVLEEGEPWGIDALGFALFEDDLVDGIHNPKGGPLAFARAPPLGLTILALFEGLVADINHPTTLFVGLVADRWRSALEEGKIG